MIGEIDRPKAEERPRTAARPAAPEIVYVKKGHGLFFTFSLCILSMAMGLAAGMGIDGTLEVTNAYNLKNRPAPTPASAPVAIIETAGASPDAAPAWYPENNKIEWSTSMRPGETPTAVDITNESKDRNRRILFYVSEQGSVRLSATLFVRAGQRALIHLPSGQYRIDIASTIDSLSWDAAKTAIPMPSFALALSSHEDEETKATRLIVAEDGKVRLSGLQKASASSTSSKKSTADQEDESSEEPTEPDFPTA